MRVQACNRFQALDARVPLGQAERNRALNKDPCKRRKPEIPQANLGGTGRNPMVPLAPRAERLRNGEFAAAPGAAQVVAERRENRARRTGPGNSFT